MAHILRFRAGFPRFFRFALRSGIALCHRHHGRTQKTLPDHVAALYDRHDGALGLTLGRDFGDRLMQIGIEFCARSLNRFDAMLAKNRLQLALGRLDSVDNRF